MSHGNSRLQKTIERHETETAELRRALESSVSQCRQLEKLNEEAYTLLMLQSCGDRVKAFKGALLPRIEASNAYLAQPVTAIKQESIADAIQSSRSSGHKGSNSSNHGISLKDDNS